MGGDSRAGTDFSVSTNRVTGKMPPAIRTSATRVFVMVRSSFTIPKRLREGRATSKCGVGLPLLDPLPKVLNSTEDAHVKGMSNFETDEHLQALM